MLSKKMQEKLKNSKLLSTDVMTEFRGRGDRIHIAPLAFSEYYPAHGGTKEESWNDYLMYGGMPYVISLPVEDKVNYLTELHKEIYLKDISERYGIFNSSGMDDLQKVLASAVSSLTNPQKIADTFKSNGTGTGFIVYTPGDTSFYPVQKK